MTRRFLARVIGPFLLLVLLGLVLGGAVWLAEDPAPSDEVVAEPAAAAFERAYAVFKGDFAAAEALASGDAGLVERTASVRAARLAFSDFDATVAGIAMPAGAVEDVAAMHAAIEDLVVKFDLQGATTTVAGYQEANPAAAAAYRSARDAIDRVRTTLRGLSEPSPGAAPAVPADLPSPGALQTPVVAPYVKEGRISAAAPWRDGLLAIGATNADPRYVDSPSLGITEAWVAAFPEILTAAAVVPAASEAPRSGISGSAVTRPDPAAPASRGNVPYLAFAVRDVDGRCSGGVISGFPALTTTTPVDVAAGQICSGLAVAAAAGYEQ